MENKIWEQYWEKEVNDDPITWQNFLYSSTRQSRERDSKEFDNGEQFIYSELDKSRDQGVYKNKHGE